MSGLRRTLLSTAAATIFLTSSNQLTTVRAFTTLRRFGLRNNFQISNSFSSISGTQRNMSNEAAKRVLVPIGTGSEEIETTCLTDTLTRFGAEVVVASVMPDKSNLVCKMSRGINILADIHISDACSPDQAKSWDLIALPGGLPGADHLRDCGDLIDLLKKQKDSGKLYAAICASPAVVFATHGLMDGIPGNTCYPAPSFREKLENPSDDDVVVHDNLVTSQGPGTSLKFAIKLGELMYGKEKADAIAAAMLV